MSRAEHADRLGYHRFWTAEHHAVPGIASGNPPLLIAAAAQRTTHIRLGSGGVMLPNHRPIVVAEQFAMLEALAPGRVDLGVGRSLGFTEPVRDALGVSAGKLAGCAEIKSEKKGPGAFDASEYICCIGSILEAGR